MGILLGLVAAIFWGFGDFLARSVTLQIGTYRTLFFMQFFGIVGLGCYLIVTGQLQYIWSNTSWQPWLWALVAVLLNVVSSFGLYRAFEIGTLTLVSPIAASYAVVTVTLAFLSGEVISFLHQLAIGVVFLGILVVTIPFDKDRKQSLFARPAALRGVGLAIVAAIGYGMTFWILDFRVTGDLGGLIPVWLIRCFTPCLLALWAPFARQPLKIPRGTIWWFIAGVGVFDTVAYIAYTMGQLQHGQIAIVTMLSSLYSAVTILLAGIFLHERLKNNQWLGISVIFAGIILVNL